MPSSLLLKFMHRNLAYESAFLTKIGAIAPRDRVGALIAVGGSTRSWKSMALECMQATIQFKTVDVTDYKKASKSTSKNKEIAPKVILRSTTVLSSDKTMK